MTKRGGHAFFPVPRGILTGSPLSWGRALWLCRVICFIAALIACAPRVCAADDGLYEAAKKEGKVVWYTSLIVNQAVRPLVEAFGKKYPGIEVKYSRGDSGPNAVKVMNEARAGKVEGDVFDGIATTPPLAAE